MFSGCAVPPHSKSRPKILDYHKSRILIDKYLYFLKKIYTLNYSIPKPSKTLSKKRSGMANARKTRCGRQRSPSPLSSPIPESNYSTSAPTTPPDSFLQLLHQLPLPKWPLEMNPPIVSLLRLWDREWINNYYIYKYLTIYRHSVSISEFEVK